MNCQTLNSTEVYATIYCNMLQLIVSLCNNSGIPSLVLENKTSNLGQGRVYQLFEDYSSSHCCIIMKIINNE